MPECRRIYGERADLTLCKTGPEVLQGADALAIVTEWREFRSPDFDHIKAAAFTGDLRWAQSLRPRTDAEGGF